MEKKDEIVFRPLSEGLGFHPFSDGLPYAPVSKSSTRPQVASGSGAVAAGPPRVAPSVSSSAIPAPAPRISVPVATSSVSESAKSSKAPELPVVRYGIGYSIKRLTAYFIDVVVNSVFFFSIVIALLLRQESNLDLFSNSHALLMTALFWGAFHWFLTTLQEVIFGASIGKWVLRLKMRGNGFLILLRSILFITSLGLGGLGIVWALFDRKKRCFHDWIVGIQPNEVR